MKTFFTTTIVCFFSYVCSAQHLSKIQAGTLDKSFGDTGIVLANYSASDANIALQKDGKFITAGSGNQISNCLMARYNANGTLDASFGENGVVLTDNSNGIDYCYDVALQDDGKIITAGEIHSGQYNHVAAARYNTDGSIDKSFGINGIIDYSIEKNTSAEVKALALQPDGKILITGLAYTDVNNYGDKSFVIRFTSEGLPDESFGTGGKVYTLFSQTAEISSLILRDNGKILMGGTYSKGPFTKFMVVSYLSNGLIDSSFGVNGFALQGLDGAALYSIALQKNGSIVTGGLKLTIGIPQYTALIQFTEKGILDSSFGENGIVLTQFEEDAEINKVLIQNDGKIIGAGTLKPGLIDASFKIIRYLPNGDIDASFGTEGSTTTSLKSILSCTDALLQNDGKILVAGETYTNENTFAFARYLNDDKTQKQIFISKLRRWLQHHNGLTWDNNNNASNYIIQRSYDGMHFSSIARINAGNNSNYTYSDPAPLSSNNYYYRLQTTSVNGAVNYSNVIAVTADEDAIKIAPNPAKNSLHIEGLSSNTKLTIVDFTGNIAISQQLTAISNHSYNLNIASLKPGNYLLKIEMNGEVVTKKFVKE